MKLLLITYFYIILAAIASFAQQDTAQSSTITSEEYTSSDTSVRMITPDELPEAGDIVLPPDLPIRRRRIKKPMPPPG
ncbi:MAG: hypothetical protein ACOCX7_04445 [Bacteroidota bacterium]